MAGRMSAACLRDRAERTTADAATPFGDCDAMTPALSPPNFTPRALAACTPRPLRNHQGFVFGHSCQDVNRKPVRLGEVHRHEIDFGFHQIRNEFDVTSEPIKLGDNEYRLTRPTESQGFSELWPIIPLAGFDFGEFRDQGPVATIEVSAD